MSDFGYLIDEEQQEYHDGYLKAMDELTSDLEEDAKDVLFEEMQTIRYNPTDNPAQDAELNLLRSQKILVDKKRKLGGAVSSFLKYKAGADGKSKAAGGRTL